MSVYGTFFTYGLAGVILIALPSCGANNPVDMRFCEQCGSQLQQQSETPKRAKQSPINKETKRPISNAMKVMLVLLAIVIGGVTVAHFTISSKLDPYKQLTKVNKAFINENYEEFMGYFAIDDGVMTDAKAFHQYMKKIDWVNEISPQITEGFKKVDKGSFADAITDEDGYKVATILDERFLGLYKQYKVKIVPIDVTAKTSLPLVKLTYGNGKTQEVTNESGHLGKFAPGVYEFTLDITDDFGNSTVKEEKSIANNENNEQQLFFDFDQKALKVTADHKNAIVYINDKSTKKKPAELMLVTLPTDGSVTMYAEYTDGDKKTLSDKVKVTSTKVHLPFVEVQKKMAVTAAKEELLTNYREYARSFYYDFRNSYEDAVNYADFSYVSNFFQDGSKLKRDYSGFVLDHRNFDFYYQYNFLTNDITDIKAVDSETLTLTSFELFEFYSTDDGDWKYEREKLYTLKVIDSSLYIANIEDIGKVKKTKIN